MFKAFIVDVLSEHSKKLFSWPPLTSCIIIILHTGLVGGFGRKPWKAFTLVTYGLGCTGY